MSSRFLCALLSTTVLLAAAPALSSAAERSAVQKKMAKKEGPAKQAAKPQSGGTEPATPPEETIEKALDAKTTCEFVETPLQDVVDYLRELHKISILLDKKALDDVGVGTDTPITFRISGVSFRSALELILRDLDLTWTIHDEALLITTPKEAEMMPVTRVYDVADLVTCRDEKGSLWADYDSLIEVLRQCVAPKSWSSAGGKGSICGLSAGGGEVLVVRQTWQNHDRIARLLEKLRQIARKSPDYGKPPLRKRPAPRRPEKGPVPGAMPGGMF